MSENPYQADAQIIDAPTADEATIRPPRPRRGGGLVLVIGWSVVLVMFALGIIEVATWIFYGTG